MLVAVLAVSCAGGVGGSGDVFVNPLSECMTPSQVQVGGEGIIQWNGFDDSVVLSLVSAGGEEYGLDVVTLTSSGLIFRVPAQVPVGLYSLFMVQQDVRTDLGEINVLDMDMPVKGLDLPSAALQGEDVPISGIGFADDCSIVLTDSYGYEYVLEVEHTYAGIIVVIPSDMPEGVYEVYLQQDGRLWLLSSSLSVYADVVVKKLEGLRLYSPYMSGSEIMLEWEILSSDPVTLTVSEYVVDGESAELEAYDRYVCDENGYFELVNDGFESSNDLGISYVFDSQGNVVVADVLIYGKKETTPFTWTYDSDGALVDISSPKVSFRSFGYENGNLVLFRQTGFTYADASLSNNPSAYDVVWGYMALMEKNDPFVYIPYLLGWYAKSSRNLPTTMYQPSPSGNGTIECALSYSFDEDGYVTCMSWTENNDHCRVEYIYE